MNVEFLEVSSLIPYHRNSKEHPDHQIEKLVNSIDEFGFNVPILIDKNSEIIAGHARLLAAQRIGMYQVPVIRLEHLTEAQIRTFRIADNKVAESNWLFGELKKELLELQEEGFDISLAGFGDEEINELLYLDCEGKTGKTDPDSVPDVPEEPISRPGDLWKCGRHRVLCGDSTASSDINRLMGIQGKADMVFTDPPYLMAFEGSVGAGGAKSHNAKHGAILNDKMSKKDGAEFLRKICSAIKQTCIGAFYVCFYRLGIDSILSAMNAVGLKWRSQIIWKKNHFNLSNSDYKSLYEPIIIGWSDDYVPIFYGWNMAHEWYGRKNERDIWEIELPAVWEIDRTKKNDLHPTMKPVELVERAILNSSRPNGTVLDLFAGSGTTLIAAERVNRSCYAMELSPEYCDVVVKRWEDFTGLKAERIQ